MAESVVKAVTPSALSTVLLCAAKDISHDYATIYATLRRYLSTSYSDRHYIVFLTLLIYLEFINYSSN